MAARAAGIELRLSEYGEGFETRDRVRLSADVLSFFFCFSSGASTRCVPLRAIRFCAFSQGEVVRRQTEVYLFFDVSGAVLPEVSQFSLDSKEEGKGEKKLSLCVESPCEFLARYVK